MTQKVRSKTLVLIGPMEQTSMIGVAPLKIKMETRNHPIEKENHLNQASIFWVPC